MSLPIANELRDQCLDQPVAVAKSHTRSGDYWDVLVADKDGEPVIFRHTDPKVSLRQRMLSQGMNFDEAIIWFNGKLVED